MLPHGERYTHQLGLHHAGRGGLRVEGIGRLEQQLADHLGALLRRVADHVAVLHIGQRLERFGRGGLCVLGRCRSVVRPGVFGRWLFLVGRCPSRTQFVAQLAEFQFVEDAVQLVHVGLLHAQRLAVERHARHLAAYRRQIFRVADLLRIGQHLGKRRLLQFGQLVLPVGRCLLHAAQHLLDASEGGNHLLRRLGADARTARNVVGRIALQTQHIDDLRSGLEAVFVEHRLHIEHLISRPETLRLEDAAALRHELGIVLVGRHQEGVVFARLIGQPRQRSDHIVGLVVGDLEDRDAVCLDDALDPRHGHGDVFGLRLALCLVGRELLVAEGAALRVEADGDTFGFERHVESRHPLAAQHVLQGLDEAVDGTGVHSFAVDERLADEAVVGAVNQCVGIEQKKLFHGEVAFIAAQR